MDKLQLLEVFKSQVQRYEKHELLAIRAKEYSDKFHSIVVERVVSDHTERAMAAETQVVLLYADMEDLVSKLGQEYQNLQTSQETPRSTLEELELRLLIGEIDDQDYQCESSPLMAYLADSDSKLGALARTVDLLKAPMARWVEISNESSLVS